jgi:hypothetical protein
VKRFRSLRESCTSTMMPSTGLPSPGRTTVSAWYSAGSMSVSSADSIRVCVNAGNGTCSTRRNSEASSGRLRNSRTIASCFKEAMATTTRWKTQIATQLGRSLRSLGGPQSRLDALGPSLYMSRRLAANRVPERLRGDPGALSDKPLRAIWSGTSYPSRERFCCRAMVQSQAQVPRYGEREPALNQGVRAQTRRGLAAPNSTRGCASWWQVIS